MLAFGGVFDRNPGIQADQSLDTALSNGRIIGVIRLDGGDVNLHMVDRGMAWHYKRYQAEQSSEDRAAYSAAEIAAQDARRGLWSTGYPVAPWDWRMR